MSAGRAADPTGRIELVTQEPKVDWMSPAGLLRTGVRAAVAGAFGAFADARELQAALRGPAEMPPLDLGHRESLWFDYVADTGDGWDATYSVAWSASRAQTVVVDGREQVLPRGELLVFGGDQVYPTPDHEAYRTRFVDPWRSAFPAPLDGGAGAAAPLLLALPGNHDWYDGLRGFTRLFCSQQPIGGWRTAQHASYFAVRLPQRWWLWGVDLQLESALDAPQRRYFEQLATTQLQPGDRVVLCSPEPNWIEESRRLERQRRGRALDRQSPRFAGLREIEGLIAQRGATLAATLAGDSHHYAHYAPATPDGGPQRITCGGGGAYLLGTHELPAELHFRGGAEREEHDRLAQCFPDAAQSRRLRDRAWRLPLHNPGFCALLGALYLLLAWVLQSASAGALAQAPDLLAALAAPAAGWGERLLRPALLLPSLLLHSPAATLGVAGLLAATGLFTRSSAEQRPGLALAAGLLHGALHLSLLLQLLQAAAVWAPPGWAAPGAGFGLQLHGALQLAAVLGLGGWLGGGLLFGLWLVLANRWAGWHGEEVFSSQGIADCKSFLRLRLDAQGLTIYPLAIPQACRRWKLGAGVQRLRRRGRSWLLRAAPGSGPRFEPADGRLGNGLLIGGRPIQVPAAAATAQEHAQ